MTTKQVLNSRSVKPQALRAWLRQAKDLLPGGVSSEWWLELKWESSDVEPTMNGDIRLKAIELADGLRCIALVCEAGVYPDGDIDDCQEVEAHTFVYLLNAAYPCVWETIDDWTRAGRARFLGFGSISTSVCPAPEVLDLRTFEGDELAASLFSSKVHDLREQKRLEEVVEAQLGVETSFHLAIVESPECA
jgi:hypothetical protein